MIRNVKTIFLLATTLFLASCEEQANEFQAHAEAVSLTKSACSAPPASVAVSRDLRPTSIYDDLFREIAAEEGLDWRMLSAIAHGESRYNAYLTSPRGAQGLMQIMPATARAFGVEEAALMEPESNIRVGAQLLRRIGKSLKHASDISPDDRDALILAAYNGGIGHVQDARRLAEKYGADPDSWADVSFYLTLMSLPQYAEDEVVECGTFRGADETIGFVSHVSSRYSAYRNSTRG